MFIFFLKFTYGERAQCASNARVTLQISGRIIKSDRTNRWLLQSGMRKKQNKLWEGIIHLPWFHATLVYRFNEGTEEVTIHRPNVSTFLSSAFIRGDLNAATRGPFIRSLISCLFSDEV